MVQLATILSTSVLVASLAPSVVVAAPIQSSASEDGLVEREPFFPLLFGAASAVGSLFKGRRKRDMEDVELDARDFDEMTDLAEREPFFPLLFGAASAVGSLFKGRRKRDLSSDEMSELVARLDTDELAELIQRNPEPFFPLLFGAASAVGSLFKGRRKRDLSSSEELITRAEAQELAELIQRNPEPFFPLLFGAASAVGSLFKGRRKRDLSAIEYEEMFEREFTQLEDLEMREFDKFEMRDYYDEDEMIARGWAELEELD
jgi:fumarate reductase subunit D